MILRKSRAFIKKAREIEADQEQSVAYELPGRLAKRPPEPRKKKPGINSFFLLAVLASEGAPF
jgi:hypothetical protein